MAVRRVRRQPILHIEHKRLTLRATRTARERSMFAASQPLPRIRFLRAWTGLNARCDARNRRRLHWVQWVRGWEARQAEQVASEASVAMVLQPAACLRLHPGLAMIPSAANLISHVNGFTMLPPDLKHGKTVHMQVFRKVYTVIERSRLMQVRVHWSSHWLMPW